MPLATRQGGLDTRKSSTVDPNTYTSAIFEKEDISDFDSEPQVVSEIVLTKVQNEITLMKESMRSSQKVIDRLKNESINPRKTPNGLDEKFEVARTTRILLDRQKRGYQLLVGQLRSEIRRIQFGKNSPIDPVLESNSHPYLPRSPIGTFPHHLSSKEQSETLNPA
jgi:hypothetical protein